MELNHHNRLNLFIHYVILSSISFLGMSIYVFVDTYFIANGIGQDGLVALNVILPSYSLFINAIAILISVGAGTLFAVKRAQKNGLESSQVMMHAYLLGLIMGIIVSIVGVVFAKPMLQFFGARQEVLTMAIEYQRVLYLFAPLFILSRIAGAIVLNDGNPKLSTIAMVASAIANVIMDFILIYVFQLGMFGAALATGIAPLVSFVVLAKHRKQASFTFMKIQVRVKAFISIVQVGFSSAVGEWSLGIVMVVTNILLLNYGGNEGIAAYGIMLNISIIYTSFLYGVGHAMQPLVSHYFGKQRHQDARMILKYGLVLNTLLAIFFYAFSRFFDTMLIELFNSQNNQLLKALSLNGFQYYFLSLIPLAINIAWITYYNSILKTKWAFILSMLRGFIFVNLFLFVLPNYIGINGVWLAPVFAESLVVILAIGLFVFKGRKNENGII